MKGNAFRRSTPINQTQEISTARRHSEMQGDHIENSVMEESYMAKIGQQSKQAIASMPIQKIELVKSPKGNQPIYSKTKPPSRQNSVLLEAKSSQSKMRIKTKEEIEN